MIICTSCQREVKAGQRVLRNYILEASGALRDPKVQHANCYDAEGPKYDEEGKEIEVVRGYLKP